MLSRQRKNSASKVSALSAALSSQISANLFIFTRNRRQVNIFRSSPCLDLLLAWSHLRRRQIFNRDTIDYSHHAVLPLLARSRRFPSMSSIPRTAAPPDRPSLHPATVKQPVGGGGPPTRSEARSAANSCVDRLPWMPCPRLKRAPRPHRPSAQKSTKTAQAPSALGTRCPSQSASTVPHSTEGSVGRPCTVRAPVAGWSLRCRPSLCPTHRDVGAAQVHAQVN
jgi:hypothetical protein